MKTTFRVYNQQQREAQQAQSKKKGSQNQYIEVPRTIGDIVSFVSAILMKIQGNSIVAAASIQAQ
jgi:hypothetical protein